MKKQEFIEQSAMRNLAHMCGGRGVADARQALYHARDLAHRIYDQVDE